jgi:putative hydrolase of the HAD superfamily
MNSPARPAVLLFDLGGVLVRWEGIQSIGKLTDRPLSPEQAREFWLRSEWVRKFERGLCSAEEFVESVVRDLDLKVTPDEFHEIFDSWVAAPFPGALELLDSLASDFTLACLSNTNAIHGEKIRQDFGFGRRFARSYFSYELGLMKPDRDVFVHVATDLELEPGEILFFDDTLECVVGARDAGYQGEQVDGVEAIRTVLTDRALI